MANIQTMPQVYPLWISTGPGMAEPVIAWEVDYANHRSAVLPGDAVLRIAPTYGYGSTPGEAMADHDRRVGIRRQLERRAA